ncbi:50S ribosomal protein L29 [Candidatus Wolfebacteria bacterium RIFOXYD12_FULL_48_21]|uniref:Large ribosomal subunit protein uL29 n=1 Tax=Candidatus Wolfebacteria bacterium RIFOXYD1_FULL_48_65 TaxID=1802561 RepID=A0A1F8E471_9BACT|nr:MAG: 50S ribosomal protein L29 [Candidatus Wolfebacteria bacterium RIFOXYD12_FULL_48_21]OGM95634.1 MAG: 50S ribosomal protein L29 [Candidatus Wolfebacteria bacterium RIFOXYD1_FULL_48_65]OGM96736.1 MAG: 50S ribosomal protein L29 [Candidatus Wolfebacteria bacterium RIFOXYD2_FULL_48_11]
MKKQDIQQLKSKSKAEMQKELSESQTKLRDLKFDLAAGKVKNVSEIKKLKKVVARLSTLITGKKEAEVN